MGKKDSVVAGNGKLVGHVAPPAPAAAAVPVVQERPMGPWERSGIGSGLVVAAILVLTQLIALWPAVVKATSTATPAPGPPTTALLFGALHTSFTADVALIVMVLLVGLAGALVGTSRRFLHYASRDQLTKRDEWAYLLRPFQGALLALITYFVLRGGFLGQDKSSPVNPYGVAAISALVGLFTHHAISKLSDVFDTMFDKPKEDREPLTVIKHPGGGANGQPAKAAAEADGPATTA